MTRTPRFSVYEAADGWRWRLIAANGRIIATGEAHTRKWDAGRAVETVKAVAPIAGLIEHKPAGPGREVARGCPDDQARGIRPEVR